MVFGASAALSYGYTYLRNRRRPGLNLPVNSKARLVGAKGAYRSYYLRSLPEGLVFSSPLQRDRFAPLRIGESVMVQLPVEGGVVTFCTKVLSRTPESEEFVVEHPQTFRRADRRIEPRDTTCAGTLATLNGSQAVMKDLSAGGARVVSTSRVQPGDTARLELPLGMGEAYGWVVAAHPGVIEGRQGIEARIQFQKPLSGLRALQRQLQ